jgi:2-keto-3-deoxy-L-rhamnonate aldolase RhmA
VIFPFAGTPEKAASAAAACRYPPAGQRGSGAGAAVRTWPQPGNFYDSADWEVVTICVVEEASALNHIDAIAANPGVDVLFIGTSDLAFSRGLRGRQNERALAAIARIADAGRRHMEQGFLLFQMPTEIGLMELGARQLLDPLGISGIPAGQRAHY